jgi:hypothetical protein
MWRRRTQPSTVDASLDRADRLAVCSYRTGRVSKR